MKSSPGVASRTFQTLGDNNINIVAISTSPIRLSMIVDAAQAVQAVQCLHTAFGLDSDDVFVETQLSAEEIAAKNEERTLNDLDEGNAGKPRGGCRPERRVRLGQEFLRVLHDVDFPASEVRALASARSAGQEGAP